ncbi:MAG TPA: RNA polymerase sigma factor [Kofleriaceae bacterium]|jgi:RNA polymerase sigma-70 factor (ECF subfamily)|nr:RNA polymerase sigma factor [Kofleriaceae bacterium]
MESPRERFRRLMEPVHERACAFARGLARSRSDGDDLFQAAVLRAYERVDSLRDDGAFRTWLYRIVVNVHRNHVRSAWWRRWSPFRDDHIEREAHYREAARAPESVASVRRAREALAKLPAAQREAIVMFEIEGMRVDEIAAVQGVSASAVKSRLTRGRERLRAHYERGAARDGVPDPLPGDA